MKAQKSTAISERSRGQNNTRGVNGVAGSQDWSDIHFAYQVALHGTLSGAAAALNVHHSTVLRRIDTLEKRLNTRLFHRHPRGYAPTEAGAALLEVASRTQEEFDRMVGKMLGADQQLTGTLVITTVAGLSSRITPLLANFQHLHPEIRIHYITDPRLFKLEFGEAHISIRGGDKPKDPDYVVQHLYEMNTCLCASPEYIRRHGVMKDFRDITGHRFISTVTPLTNSAPMRWIAENIPDEQIYYRTSDFVSMRHAAEAGIGIAPVTSGPEIDRRFLVPMLTPPSEWKTSLWLITHRDIHRSSKVQEVARFIKEYFQPE